jgi:hypothetical protein
VLKRLEIIIISTTAMRRHLHKMDHRISVGFPDVYAHGGRPARVQGRTGATRTGLGKR